MKLTWLGHSAFRIETGASVILIDPFLKGNPTFESSGLDWDTVTAGVTHVALTHGHDDHLGDTAEICKKRGATLFAVWELATYLAGKGVEKYEPMNTGGTVCAQDFVLHMGDTDIFPGMALINEIHQPDIGIVPIGDRFTMGARTAALACKKFFNFKAVIPCHYATFGLIAPNADQFLTEMKPNPVTVPKVGEVLAF